MSGRRFRASSWGSAAIILALLLLILHRFGSFLLFFVIGAGLLWYGRRQREEAKRDDASRAGEDRSAAEAPAPRAEGQPGGGRQAGGDEPERAVDGGRETDGPV